MTKKSDYLILTILGVVLAGFALTATLAAGIYAFGWNNQLTRTVVEFIPLPAALVNGHFVTLHEVYVREKMLDKILHFQGGSAETVPGQSRDILEQLIEEQIVRGYANANGIVVTQAELDRYFLYLLNGFSIPPDQVDAKIQELFGVSAAEYKKRIVMPDLLEQELRLYLNENSQDERRFQEAAFVQKKLIDGMDFTEAAKTYSQDEQTKHLGGDLGFVASRELPYWLADPAFGLETGEISQIIFSPEGFHILEVTLKDSSSDPGRIRLRHIFFEGEDFEAFLENAKKSYNIYAFEKI